MKVSFNSELLTTHITDKRVVDAKKHILISSTAAATIVGISKATMSRVMNGGAVDIISLYKICKWLGNPMETYFKVSKK
jgi:DNA-binding Xre family transcriptional regulator